jgi:glycine hydroxymethyltransferase
VDAWLVADISHIAGLIVGGVHPSPVDYVHVVSSTTHKTLRGPRGAFIGVTKKGLEKDPDLAKKIDRAVFPGMQGGPHENNIAAMAVAFGEASTPEFKEYASQIIKNAKVLAETLSAEGLKVYGTENHLMVVDVGFDEKTVDDKTIFVGRGKEMAMRLEEEGIIVNANTVPHDVCGPFRASGIRLGSPAMTTKGWKEKEFEEVGKRIAGIILR